MNTLFIILSGLLLFASIYEYNQSKLYSNIVNTYRMYSNVRQKFYTKEFILTSIIMFIMFLCF